MAARVTQPVPCTSSLKQGIEGRYRSRIRRAGGVNMRIRGKDGRGYTIRKTEVFEVDVGSWVEFSSGLHECINEIVVFLASGSGLSKTEIQIIV